MNSLIAAAKVFASDEDGITAIEYGLIAAVMVTCVAAAFTPLKTALTDAFVKLSGKIVVT
jgi:pilus assembly protein Flp/PilA